MNKTYLVERKDFNSKIPALQAYLTYTGKALTVGVIKTDENQYIAFTVWYDTNFVEILVDTESKAKYVKENFIGRWAE